MRLKERKYHYFYKITNNLNGHFYYGVHNTDNLDDGYMGSGRRLHYAYKKYGIENFTKEILKYFDTSREAFEYEAEVVTEELINTSNCYNVQTGGTGFGKLGLTVVVDKDGNHFSINTDNDKFINGEYISINKGKTTYIDKFGNYIYTSIDDDRVLSGELISPQKGKVLVKDNNNNNYWVSLNDERYLSGKLKPIWVGKKHSIKTKNKFKETFKKIHHQQGEKNSQYGTCWITKDKENKKIKKEELEYYISLGWNKGRYIKTKE